TVLRFGKTNERPRSEILNLEQCADLPAGALGDHHCSGSGQCLRPSRKATRYRSSERRLASRLASAASSGDRLVSEPTVLLRLRESGSPRAIEALVLYFAHTVRRRLAEDSK